MSLSNNLYNIIAVPVIGLFIYSGYTNLEFTDNTYVPDTEVLISSNANEIAHTPVKGLEDFKNDLGFKESGNRYDAVNPWGYLGRYQFSPNILWRLGYEVTRDEFLSNPSLQEQAFETLLYHNYDILKPTVEKFDGRSVNGVVVTKSGILAAAHLIGPTRTKIYLNHNKNYKDGLGTQVSDYIELFSGYELKLKTRI